MRKPERKLFVEGGGRHQPELETECRQAFNTLLLKAGFKGRTPRIVACGGRQDAYEQFCTARSDPVEGDVAILLVDAEAPVTVSSPWEHVKQRRGDAWQKTNGASDDHLHLMVQCMEAWFLSDRKAMAEFFGNGFRESALPALTADIENVPKVDLYDKLKAATRDTKTKGAYGKGSHSFKLLAMMDPTLIRRASGWADRFFKTLDLLLK